MNILPCGWSPQKKIKKLNHKIRMHYRWKQFLLSQLKWGMQSGKQISLWGPNVSRGDQSWISLTNNKSSTFQPKQAKRRPPNDFSSPSMLLLLQSNHISNIFGELGSQVVREVHRDCPNSCCPSACDQCLSPQSKHPPHPARYTLFRCSDCAWWLIHVLRTANTR